MEGYISKELSGPVVLATNLVDSIPFSEMVRVHEVTRCMSGLAQEALSEHHHLVLYDICGCGVRHGHLCHSTRSACSSTCPICTRMTQIGRVFDLSGVAATCQSVVAVVPTKSVLP